MTKQLTPELKATLEAQISKSYKTPLKPLAYGKRESNKANKSLSVTLQLFKPTLENKEMIVPILSSNGTIKFHKLTLMTLSNSKTNNVSMQNRPIFISTSLDSGEYLTKANRVNYNDSNAQCLKSLFDEGSPMNSCIVKGSVATMLIPRTNEFDSVEHNMLAYTLAVKLAKVEESSSVESIKLKAYQDIWDEYQSKLNVLMDKGLLAYNNVVVVEPNGLVPTISVSQYTNSSNKYLNARSLYSTADSKATFAPIVNSLTGVLELTDSETDPSSSYTYGLNNTQLASNSDESIGFKRFSSEAYAYDVVNQLTTESLRLVVSDVSYGKTSRAEQFMEFKNKNNTVFINDGELVLAPRETGNTYTSRFSIEGNVSYTSYKNTSTTSTNTIEIIDSLDTFLDSCEEGDEVGVIKADEKSEMVDSVEDLSTF